MKLKYKTVDTRTINGLRKAEKLKSAGWLIGSIGLWTIEFYRPIKLVYNRKKP